MNRLVFEAIDYAVRCHQGQFRKGTKIPYIVHPLGMLRFLARLEAPPELQAAAVLHDVVEDTEATVADLEQRFGARVAALVQAATEEDRTLSWKERKLAAIAKTRTSSDLDLMVLKCADKLDNLSDIREDLELHGEELWARFRVAQESQRWYYGTLTRLFLERLEGTRYQKLAEELATVYQAVFGPLESPAANS